MIPSANSAGDLSTWHADNWALHQGGASAAAVGTEYNSSVSSSIDTATAGDHSRYISLHRHQVLDWENAMLLAQHSNGTRSTHNGHESVYDHVAGYHKAAAGITSMQAEAIASLSQPRHYEELLSAHMASSNSTGSFTTNVNAWGLLNTVCSRSSGNTLQQEASLLQTEGTQYAYEGLSGADALGGGYSGLAGAASATALYADSLRSSSGSSNIGALTSFDQRRLDDIMKRELYTTHDLNSRLGLNLGGRTYFSADDFAFGRWGKRLRPNSPGCAMQPAPLCQAEGCKADLSMAKHYHRRHKVCEYHSKAATVHIGDQTQRFCQQCSRFHLLDEFDDGKRSCRKRLADHNRRRRKPQPTPAATQQLVAAEELGSTTGEDNGADQPKMEAEEAATGSDSLPTGAMCNQGSPLQSISAPADEGDLPKADHGAPTISADRASLAAASISVLNSMELATNIELKINVDQQEKVLQTHDINNQQSKGNITSASSTVTYMQGLPRASSGSINHRHCNTSDNNILAISANPGASHLAATLSLGGASTGSTDILDLKPGSNHMLLQKDNNIHVDARRHAQDAAAAAAAPAGRPFESSSLSANKPALLMPWLQATSAIKKSQSALQGSTSREDATNASRRAGEASGGEHPQYAERAAVRSFKSITSSADFKDSDMNGEGGGSWMSMRGCNNMGADAASCGAANEAAAAPRPGSGGVCGNELLGFLGDDRDHEALVSMRDNNNVVKPVCGGSSSTTVNNSMGTLAFLDPSSSSFNGASAVLAAAATGRVPERQLHSFSSLNRGAAGPSATAATAASLSFDSHTHSTYI